jgi:hypothetical protein
LVVETTRDMKFGGNVIILSLVVETTRDMEFGGNLVFVGENNEEEEIPEEDDIEEEEEDPTGAEGGEDGEVSVKDNPQTVVSIRGMDI